MVIKKKKKVMKGVGGGGRNQFEGFKPSNNDLSYAHKEEGKEEDVLGWGRQNSDATNVPPESTKMTEKSRPRVQPKQPPDVKHQLLEDLRAQHNPFKPLLQ